MAERQEEYDRAPVPEANLDELRSFDPNQDIARVENAVRERIGLASDGMP